MICKVCKVFIYSIESLTCSKCNNHFHHNCLNITSAYYMANTERWKDFKCDACQHTLQQKSPQEQECSNKPSTSNHSNSLPLTPASANDNVTQRRPRQLIPSVHQHNSHDDVSILDISCQSLPGVVESGEQLGELRERNSNLCIQLDIANTEIENLSLEIASLKKQLAEKNMKIELYKAVGLDETKNSHKLYPKFYSPQYRNIQVGYPRTSPIEFTRRAVTHMDPNGHNNTTLRAESAADVESRKLLHSRPDSPLGETPVFRATDELASIRPDAYKKTSNTRISSKSTTQPSQKRRVLIISDEQGRGICQLLQGLLGEEFRVQSVIKPYATMDQVLESCSLLCKGYGKNDYIVILGGSNDKDPIRLKSLLYYNLSLLVNMNVILCNVSTNANLNEDKINSTFRHLCSRFTHTTFLDVSDSECSHRMRLNKLYACRVLLREICRIHHTQKYWDYISSRQSQTTYVNPKTQTNSVTLVDMQTQTDLVTSSDLNANTEMPGESLDFFRA